MNARRMLTFIASAAFAASFAALIFLPSAAIPGESQLNLEYNPGSGSFGFFEKAGGSSANFFDSSLLHFDTVPSDRFVTHGIGRESLLNFKATIPIALNRDWNLVGRTHFPMYASAYFPYPVKRDENHYETGDLSFMALFSPAGGDDVLSWGVGPSLILPTSLNNDYGEGKLQIGPAAVLSYSNEGWLTGILSQHLWSFANQSDRSRGSQTSIQYFAEYNLSSRFQIGLSQSILLNWNQQSQAPYFPIDLDRARTLSLNKLPLKFTLDGFFEVNATWRF